VSDYKFRQGVYSIPGRKLGTAGQADPIVSAHFAAQLLGKPRVWQTEALWQVRLNSWLQDLHIGKGPFDLEFYVPGALQIKSNLALLSYRVGVHKDSIGSHSVKGAAGVPSGV
jgi:hypothetical protein